MKSRSVDVAVIGAGTAGLNARRAAEKLGKTAICVDPGPFGTTCARVGCMPSKLLIAAAEAAHHVRGAEVFGVKGRVEEIDGVAVMDRVRRERDRFVSFVLEDIEELAEAESLIKGKATFTGEGCLEIDGEGKLEYGSVVIATGSSAFVPPPYRDLGDRLITNDDVFDWVDLPESVLVVGSGVIGLELGQALHRLGVRVTVLGVRGVIGPLSDEVIRAKAEEIFAEELPLLNNFNVESAQRVEGGVHVKGEDAKRGKLDETFEYVLMAAGRRPNLKSLNLEAAGVELDERGLPKHLDPRTLQLGDKPIFLAGDVSDIRPLLHEAVDQAKLAGRNAVTFPQVVQATWRAPIGVIFCDPQIALVGERHEDLCPGTFATGEVSFHNQGRSRVMNVNKGMLHIYGEGGTGRILGAEMIGPRMEHIAHLLSWSIQEGLTCKTLLQMPFYHPTIEEGLRTALYDLRKALSELHPPEQPGQNITPGA